MNARILASTTIDVVHTLDVTVRSGSPTKVREDAVAVGITERAIALHPSSSTGGIKRIEAVGRTKVEWTAPSIVECDASVVPVTLDVLVRDRDCLAHGSIAAVNTDTSGLGQWLRRSAIAHSYNGKRDRARYGEKKRRIHFSPPKGLLAIV